MFHFGQFWLFWGEFPKIAFLKQNGPPLGPKNRSKLLFTLKTVQTPLKFDVYQKSSISIKKWPKCRGSLIWTTLGKCGSILTFVKLGLKNIVTGCAFVVNRGLTKQIQFLHNIRMHEFQNWDLLYRICKIWPFLWQIFLYYLWIVKFGPFWNWEE